MAAGLAALAVACAARPGRSRLAGAAAAATAAPAAWTGRWEGLFRTPGEVPTPITVTLDPAAGGGLTGALTAPGIAPVPFASAAAAGDSLALRLPAAFQHLAYRGRRSADGRRYEGRIDGAGVPIPFALARAGTPDARALAAVGARVAALRAAAERLAAAALAESSLVRWQDDPEVSRLVTADVRRFWAAVDRAGPGAPADDLRGLASDSLAALLQRDYLEPGSPGLHEFIPGRIRSAEDLAAAVRGQRARYDAIRAGTLRVAEAAPGIRAVFRRFKALYPAAVFPDVYVVVGRFSAGGTSGPHGPIIAAETQPDPARVPAVAAHEVVHYQQPPGDERTLLGQSLREGTADFLGEMAAGVPFDDEKRRYGTAHEHALWQEFARQLDSTNTAAWLYGTPPAGRPADLGYFVGYRIAQAYYLRAADKARAVRNLIAARGDGAKAILAASGYNP